VPLCAAILVLKAKNVISIFMSISLTQPVALQAIFVLQDRKRLPGRFLAAFTGAVQSRLR
jgi:hypothetical protein